MQVYLGLGSNLGERRSLLEQALTLLDARGVRIRRASPAIETPALLPPAAPADWNRPFLNAAVEADTALAPDALLDTLKTVERELGRSRPDTWGPRPVDIDILTYGREVIVTETLTIPHPSLMQRDFVLTPLAALAPDLVIPGTNGRTVLAALRALESRTPLWMGIVNVTPDSFSDGGRHVSPEGVAAALDAMQDHAQIIDLGAESTRPGATPLDADAEWARLEPALAVVGDYYRGRRLRPLLSVDTYHVSVAARAIERGADIINDVSGLTSDAMLELATGTPRIDFIAMHSLTVPADPARELDTQADPIRELNDWLLRQRNRVESAGIRTSRIVFDPGIGFGKNPLQSLAILRRLDELELGDFRCLVGHSRKSFMAAFGPSDAGQRDLVTVGASLRLAARGVEILRVHDIAAHANAWLGWSHLTGP